MTQHPPSDTGMESDVSGEMSRHDWLTPDRQAQVRNILLGLALFAGLVVWVWHSLGPQVRPVELAGKLRVVGVMTWLYALIQIADMRFWHSSLAERRRVTSGIPESVIRQRFAKSVDYFEKHYKAIVDEWYVWDSLEDEFRLAESWND